MDTAGSKFVGVQDRRIYASTVIRIEAHSHSVVLLPVAVARDIDKYISLALLTVITNVLMID